jgi:Tfp pilus assembly protein PilN
MRPINLIPEGERRRRQGGAGRTGPLAFVVVGALLLALVGVVALVTTSNKVSDRESELASLTIRTEAAQTRAERLVPFAAFHEVKTQRTATVSELADNRFNWSRTLQELSLVMPRFVVLASISGSSGGKNSIAGPSLEVSGCAKSQTRVAQMVAALKRIDGVTRVGLPASGQPPKGSEAGSGSGETDCPFKVAFVAVAAFDGAPLPADSSGTEAAEAEVAAAAESTESSEGESSGSTEGPEESTETSPDGSTTKTTVQTESVPPK